MATRTPARSLLFASLLACLVGCGSAGDPPAAEPFSHPLLTEASAHDGETPEGAASLDPETFVAYLERGEARLLMPGSSQDELDSLAKEETEALARARGVFANDPRMLALLNQLPLPDGKDTQRLPDGSVRYRGIHEDADAGRAERFFLLRGIGPGLEDALEAKQQFESADTQHGIYAQMYPGLPTDYINQEQLPDPSEIENESFEVLRDLNRRVGRDWDRFVGEPDPLNWPEGYPVSWRDEEGVDWRSDRDQALDVYPSGIWRDAGFGLKWCATHVRDQGLRGTDAAFAVTAAVEARFAAIRSRWLNLSEQMLYNQALGFWRGRYWEESLRVWWFLRQMVDRGFTYPFESSWDYNRSLFREVLPLRYVKSCWVDAAATLYGGEHCSDTGHQSTVIYTRVERREFRAVVDPASTIPGDAGVQVTDFREIFGSTESHRGPDGSLEDPLLLARAMLSVKIPVVLMFWMPASFVDATDSDGIVPLDPPGGLSRIHPAFHSMVLLGYVPNASLPAGTPPGSGGGYFIAKNSYGTAWGDAGYCYVSDDWILRFVYSMYAVSHVVG